MSEEQEQAKMLSKLFSTLQSVVQRIGYQGKKEHKYYSNSLVIWLMLWQNFQEQRFTNPLFEAVSSRGKALAGSCKRKREESISQNSSAFCQARQDLEMSVVEEAFDALYAQLRGEEVLWYGRRVFALDGTTLALESVEELREQFPPARNQHGKCHNPLLFLGLAHDVLSGVAVRPVWGAMYGDKTTSEQRMARESLSRLEPGSVVLGDRNYGCFSVVWYASENKHDVIFRLKDKQAEKILGKGTGKQRDESVVWSISAADRKTNPELPDDATIEGRVIVLNKFLDGKTETFSFFTTLKNVAAEDLFALYGKRWSIETDIRTLKYVSGLRRISGKSKNVVEKEVILGIAAYNLVRALMVFVAKHLNCSPREISFSGVNVGCHWMLGQLPHARTQEKRNEIWEFFLKASTGSKLPKRKKPRSCKREIIHKPQPFKTRAPLPL